MSTFIYVSPITKLGIGTASVLIPTLITFCKINCVFRIAIKLFVNVINFVRISLFKSWSLFYQLTPRFPKHGPELPAASMLPKTDLKRWSFPVFKTYSGDICESFPTLHIIYKCISISISIYLYIHLSTTHHISLHITIYYGYQTLKCFFLQLGNH